MKAGILDIFKSIYTEPAIDLYLAGYTISDSNGGNSDGIPNPGETLEVFISAKNAGGLANDVKAKLRFSEFEDQSTAKIVKCTSNIGSISPYGTMHASDPIEVEIAEDVAHARIISFEVMLWQEGETDTMYYDLPIKVRTGISISGAYPGLMHLKEDGYYVVTGPAIIDSLIIEPGLTLRFANSSFLMINHYMYAVGEPYKMITFMGDVDSYVEGIIMADHAESTFKYCIFQDGYSNSYLTNSQVIKHSIFRYNVGGLFKVYQQNDVQNNVLVENYESFVAYWRVPIAFKYNVIANNVREPGFGIRSTIRFLRDSYLDLSVFYKNVLINNYEFSVATSDWNGWPMGIYSLPNQYWGSSCPEYAKEQIYDFYHRSSLPVLEPGSILEKPPSEAHGVVWKVLINEENPMDGHLEPLGAGPAKFEVHFNRPMDIEHEPFVTFGVRAPYNQNLVVDNASWSADSTIWSATYTMELNTGDGINRVRVAHASDTDGFEIPVERERFNFSVQVAGSQAVDFFAQPGIGIISLTWPEAESAEVLGYNMYRFKMLDTLATDTLLINNVLITDNVFTDYNVIPDSTYYYMFTMLGTDFTESDFSKVVFASPYKAATGDANGDYNVDVLDIVTIIAYMLGQNPQPFIFEAADVNQDGVINVLDIVGVVQLINGKKNRISTHIQTHPDPAYINLKDNIIQLESVGQLTALQFELHTAFPEQVQLLSNLPGFDLAWTKTNEGILGYLFNMQNKCIPKGINDIIYIQHQNPDLQWGELLGADPEGKIVEIHKNPVGISEQAYLPDELKLGIFPNPARGLLNIEYILPMTADVEVTLHDIYGRKLGRESFSEQPPGQHLQTIDTRRHNLPEGIVFCQVTARGKNGGFLQKTVRVMLIK